jgi:predicted HNH restriction endonuclease
MKRIRERDLILPALYLINNHPGISTSELISGLEKILNPTGEDAKILKGRSDTKFSQIVRNLVAHHTIDQQGLGYTNYEHIGSNGYFTVTPSGKSYLDQNLSVISYLLENGFQYSDFLEGVQEISDAHSKNRKILEFDEDDPIFEGRKRISSSVVSERSRTLRDAAIQYYSIDGHIKCEVCGFDFYTVYGELGKGFIEIHHKKPLYQYEDEDMGIFLSEAVERVSPLCSNCHRMIHRNRASTLDVDEFKAKLEAQSE